MKARSTADELSAYLGHLLHFVGSADFESERRLAREEYYQGSRATVDSRAAGARAGSYLDWFIFERRHSRATVTPLRMYLERHPDLPSRVRANLLRCESSRPSVYRLMAAGPEWLVVLDLGGDDTDYYRVRRTETTDDRRVGEMVAGRLVRWDEEYHFLGPVEPWPRTVRDIAGPSGGRSPGRDAGRGLRRRQGRVRNPAQRLSWLRRKRREP